MKQRLVKQRLDVTEVPGFWAASSVNNIDSSLIYDQLLSGQMINSDLIPFVKRLIFDDAELPNLELLTNLTHLELLGFNGKKIDDLTPLSKMPSLHWISLKNAGPHHILPALPKLGNITIGGKATSLECCRKCYTLMKLTASNTLVTDIGPVDRMKNLETLDIRDNAMITDLSPIRGLEKLQDIFMSKTRVSDLSPLKYKTSLRGLTIYDTQVRDLSPLENLNNLQFLYCSDLRIRDIGALAKLNKLRILDLENIQISDLRPLSGLNNLEMLRISGTNVTDLSPLAPLKKLKVLGIHRTGITDISPLKGISGFKNLVIESNLKRREQLAAAWGGDGAADIVVSERWVGEELPY